MRSEEHLTDDNSALVVRKLIECHSVNGHHAMLTGEWKRIGDAIDACPLISHERQQAFEAAIAKMPDQDRIRELVQVADSSTNVDFKPITAQATSLSTDMPALPNACQIPEKCGNTASPWLDEYVDFSRRWAPRAYDDFHEAVALWILSTVVARRVYTNLGKQRFPNLYIALVARSSIYTKSTAAEIGINVLQQSGLSWFLAPNSSTPQKFIADMSGQPISNLETMSEEQKLWVTMRALFTGQRGWFFDEFGQYIDAMMRDSGVMADFHGLLRQFDDTPERYEYSTISRGSNLIQRPYLSLLANMTPSDLRKHAKKHAALWGDGFLARFGLITPPESELKLGRFPQVERIISESLISPLVAMHRRLGIPEYTYVDIPREDGKPSGLKKVNFSPNPSTVLDISKDVYEAFYAYQDGLTEITCDLDTQDLDGNYARFGEKALRIALSLAAISDSPKIEFCHWARAQQTTERWRGGLHELYRQLNEGSFSKERDFEDRVLAVINRKEAPTAREIRLTTGLSSNEVKDTLNSLMEADLISENRVGKTNRYSLNSEESGEV